MSECLNCGKQTPTTKTGKPKKYCDNKCANKYYSKEGRYRAKDADGNLLNPDWGIRANKEKERKQKQKEKYGWYKTNWYTRDRIANEYGISTNAVWHRAKTAGIKPTFFGWSGKTGFWSPEDAKIIATINEQITPIPKGYLTKPKAAQYLGITKSTFGQYGANYGHPKYIEWQQTHGHKITQKLYTKSDLDKWKAHIEKTRQEKSAETKRRQEERRLQREQATLQKQKDFKNATKNLITRHQTAEIMGYKSPQAFDHARNKLTPIIFKGHRPRIWFNKEEVLKAAKELEAERKEQKRLYEEKWKGYGNNHRVPLKTSDWKSDEEYEKKLKQRISEVGPSESVKKHKTQLATWNANAEMMRLYEEKNIITKLSCKDCRQELPYWKFYADFSSFKRKGRRNQCRPCSLKRRQSHNKNPRKQNKKQIFPTYFAMGIKQSLSSKQKEYCEMSNTLIWDKIKRLLGYNRQEFISYIESQFEPWMTWDNHGRSPKLGKPKWQLDHIKPKSSFNYTSMEDQDFIECWSLKNLKPIQARLNALKSNKNLRSGIRHSFLRGLKKKTKTGIWSELPYSIEEAKKHLEKQFAVGMSWKNHGKLWDIDHIIPQAALPFTTTRDVNFKKCWSLANLKPMLKSKNCAKGSRYNNIIHVYNDE
jgi:hypothetical protein